MKLIITFGKVSWLLGHNEYIFFIFDNTKLSCFGASNGWGSSKASIHTYEHVR